MPLTVTGVLASFDAGGDHGVAVGVVTATPSLLPLFIKVGSAWYEVEPATRSANASISTGAWSIVLPWPSESDPNTVQWRIKLPDGFEWMGTVPEGVSGPVAIRDLKNTYGWGIVSPTVIGTVAAIQGLPIVENGATPLPRRDTLHVDGTSILATDTGTAIDLTLGNVLPAVSNQEFAVLMEEPAGTPVFARLSQDMILAAFTISSFARSTGAASPLEVGATLANPQFTASYNRSAAAATLGDGSDVLALPSPFTGFGYGGAGTLPARSYQKTAVGAAVTWTLTANETNGPSKTSAIATFWYPRVFYDVAVPGTLNAAFIAALTAQALASGFARTIAFGAGGGTKKLYYAFPTSFGAPASFKDTATGFGVPFSKVASAVAVTNSFGVTLNYDVWGSDQFLTNAVTVQIA